MGSVPNPQAVTMTLVGGPTVLFEYAGLRVLTDPTLSPPGDYDGLTKTRGPAITPARIGPIDVALVSHDHHPDNLDDAGVALLADIPVALCTTEGAGRVDALRGMEPWDAIQVGAGGSVTVTAVPALHGPPGVAEVIGPVIGFVLQAAGWPTVYFSGDNSEVAVPREIASRYPEVALAILCAGAARVPQRTPEPLTLDAARVEQVATLWPGASIVPVHTDDWAHFSEPRDALQAALAGSPVASRLVWLVPGVPATIG